ncbi:hypothetical protein GUJ93_ZPchr0003g17443 [Zizania palustris]|uniref:Uncharacterized protein n=1 Tax=Zizania palustris TaxID=103762 RepID=A0A8J5S872_ZIZPA|nr:hypothetical protein GUJ93_ZPchr0003g17443 [Zizania palustris]
MAGPPCRSPAAWRPLVACLLVAAFLPPLSGAAKVVTHLPGFDGPLPFYLETGYVGLDDEAGTELFYYFVESERNPSQDPLVLWLTGGPGCSGFSGFVYEVGPLNYKVVPYNGSLPQLISNPYSWTKLASFLFLDTPVGSGFSYARDPKGFYVGDSISCLQVVTFLKKWFNDHPQYLPNHFYLGGSSYAAKMIPVITTHVLEEIEARRQPLINLKGYIVGNPVTGSDIDMNFRVPYAHGVGIISDQLYEAAMKNCNGDYVNPANKICGQVLQTIHDLIYEVSIDDILEDKCVLIAPKPTNGDSGSRILSEEHIQLRNPPPEPGIECFTYMYYLSYFWANYNGTRDALGIREGTVDEWIRCNRTMHYTPDIPSSIGYHHIVNNKGYRVLVYSGDHDLSVPFLGTHSWIRSFEYPVVDDWRAWHVDGQTAGFTIRYNNLTFATLKGAGHTAVEYVRKQGFAMAQRWIDELPL